ncbi:unnamed protein product [Rotaria sordida]|uniref:Fascin-like domain-containing protein n=1 Tax=Rotaria sordida TaxID=392033 RepID=A0A819G437_9BILA|nr:unnamed protein product [Rotaria sordida]CAF3879916.1 unnamed protein product [Rotaria sordida]
MHSALRPKPSAKIPPSLIPPTVTHIKKPSISQNGHHEKAIVNVKQHHEKAITNGKQSHSKVTLNENGHNHEHTKSNNLISEKCTWSLGLINSKGKYLTAETFGCKINATGTCLKKKQTWTIIYNIPNDCVYLQSSLNHYLSTDKYGRLKCDGHDMVDDCRFQLEYNQNGQWGFKSLTYGMYLGGDVDQLHCFSKTPEWWSPHLALYPQINLKHVLRKRYAKLNDDEIHIDDIIPWGSEAILTVEYFDGQYCIRSCNGYYFHKDGKLITKKTHDTLFTIELFKGYLTFKDCNHCYLTAIGPLGIMTTRNKIAGKDEQFLLEESKQQICLIAPNGKHVSIKQGVDLSANQCEKDNSSIFQLEYDEHLELYHIRTYNNKYWKLEGHGVQATADKRSIETGFYIQSTGNGHVTFQASNGKYIIPHATGHMRAIGEQLNSMESYFLLKFINRPFCVFKCDFGYVGYRNKQSRILECNKSMFTLFTLEEPIGEINNDGVVYLKGSDGMYWEILSDLSISVSGREPTKFILELCPAYSRIVIKASNGMYLHAEQNGIIQASCEQSRHAIQWEF